MSAAENMQFVVVENSIAQHLCVYFQKGRICLEDQTLYLSQYDASNACL